MSRCEMSRKKARGKRDIGATYYPIENTVQINECRGDATFGWRDMSRNVAGLTEILLLTRFLAVIPAKAGNQYRRSL
jgi:hypothetical protein